MHMNFTLTSDERRFFSSVAKAAFANPFGRERKAADYEISGLEGEGGEKLLSGVIQVVEEKLDTLLEAGRADLRRYSGKDRHLLTHFLLFHIFHHYYREMDRHIQQQRTAGDEPIGIEFLPKMIHDFRAFGFAAEDVDRNIAIFFQMRRAFFFISTSLVGEGRTMRQLRARLWNNVFTHDLSLYLDSLWNRLEDFSTLLLGETGTGKGLAAVAIGMSGFIPLDRRAGRFETSFTRAFLSIHLAQYPESLIESELFGHAKGAFTGAVGKYDGIFARSSSRGAVFLDEIGEVPVPIQIKLLTILQDRVFAPVGSHQVQRFRGRVISATNQDIDLLLHAGKFREDFYYRLSSDVIRLPSLRERLQEDPGELDRLTEFLLNRIVGHSSGGLMDRVRSALGRDLPADYRWRGNVRELEQGIRRILLNQEYRPAQESPDSEEMDACLGRMAEGAVSIAELTEQYCRNLHGRFGTYQEVARRTGLDRRTVKKILDDTGPKESPTGPGSR